MIQFIYFYKYLYFSTILIKYTLRFFFFFLRSEKCILQVTKECCNSHSFIQQILTEQLLLSLL